LDALSGGFEDKVARRMAEHVVDLLKLIDPDNQHGQLCILAVARNRRRDAGMEGRAVRQAVVVSYSAR